MHKVFLFFVCFVQCMALHAQQQTILEVPGRDSFAIIRAGGVSVLPSGRYVTPAGRVRRITHDPFGMAVSPMERRQ